MDHMQKWAAWVHRIAPERLLLLLLLAIAIGAWAWALCLLPRPLEVVALSVGDGDCYLIRAPSGHAMLLDGGSRSVPDVGERVLVPNLMLLGVRKLDAILLTHPDSDHVNGLPAVMDALPVGMLLDPEQPCETTQYQQVLETARAHNIPRFRVRAGNRIHLDHRTSLRMLAPGDRWLVGTDSDSNNNTLVCLLEYGHSRMLFTGDLQTEGEQALLARMASFRADVLTVAHHGSRNGTSAALLDAVRPYLAVISSRGDLTGHHPHPSVLTRLRDRGIRILRTDVNGRIRLRSDGNSWQADTYRDAAADAR